MCSDLNNERSCQKKELPCYLWTERNCPSLKETCIASLFRILHFLTFDTVHSFLWTSKWKLKMESHFHKKRKEGFLPCKHVGTNHLYGGATNAMHAARSNIKAAMDKCSPLVLVL